MEKQRNRLRHRCGGKHHSSSYSWPEKLLTSMGRNIKQSGEISMPESYIAVAMTFAVLLGINL